MTGAKPVSDPSPLVEDDGVRSHGKSPLDEPARQRLLRTLRAELVKANSAALARGVRPKELDDYYRSRAAHLRSEIESADAQDAQDHADDTVEFGRVVD